MALNRPDSLDSPFESFFGQVAEPLLLLTPDGRITAVNRSWENLTGFAAPEVLGINCHRPDLTNTSELAGLTKNFCPPPTALLGQSAVSEIRLTCKGKESVLQSVLFWPFHDHNGQLNGILAIVRPPGSDVVVRIPDQQSLRLTLIELRARMLARYAHDTLIGHGAEHTRVLNGIAAAASSLIPVSIIGEPGTGKRFVARLIHQQSARRQMPILWYDCQAIPATILERELLGNSDSSSSLQEWGRLIAPEGSTVVLGDILETHREFQYRLASGLLEPDRAARLIATSAGSLDTAWREERLHPDLYQALTALVIQLRPLRDRLDELPLLAQAMLDRANLRGSKKRLEFRDEAIAALLAYDWPGNLRELAKVIEAAHQTSEDESIARKDLPVQIRGELGGAYLPPAPAIARQSLKDQLLAYERQLIEQALHQFHDNKTRAARFLGVNRPFLYRRIKELDIADADTTTQTRATDPGQRVSEPDADEDANAQG